MLVMVGCDVASKTLFLEDLKDMGRASVKQARTGFVLS
jgi:predicted ATPase